MPPPVTNSLIRSVATPPIADVAGWVKDREFPSGKPLLDVCQAVPSYSPDEALRTHMGRCLAEPATSIYTDIVGLQPLRQAVAAQINDDYEGRVNLDHVAITAGCNQAFCIAIDTLAGPGDEVIMPLPYYFNHAMWLSMRGIVAVHPLFDEGLPDIDRIEQCINERTRAIAIVSPNNPTGLEYPASLIERFFHLAQQHSIALVLDETYKDFRSTAGPPHTLFQQANWQDNFVHLFSFSKSYAMTGYRVGGLVAATDFIGEATKLLDCIAICPSHVGQLGALYAIENLSEWRDEKVNLMKDRVDTLRNSFKSNRLTYQLVSSGAYFAYLRHPFESEGATAVARRLADEHNVLCLPGNMFGSGQENYLRFAFANLEVNDIPVLVQRLIDSQ